MMGDDDIGDFHGDPGSSFVRRTLCPSNLRFSKPFFSFRHDVAVSSRPLLRRTA
jgi:hypothetical protein